MGGLKEGTSFGEYMESFPGLGLQEKKAAAPPKPQKSAKELIAWANALTEKAKADKAKEQAA